MPPAAQGWTLPAALPQGWQHGWRASYPPLPAAAGLHATQLVSDCMTAPGDGDIVTASALHLQVIQAHVQPWQCCSRGLPVLVCWVVQLMLQLLCCLQGSGCGTSGRAADVMVKRQGRAALPRKCVMRHRTHLGPQTWAGCSSKRPATMLLRKAPAHKAEPPAKLGCEWS